MADRGRGRGIGRGGVQRGGAARGGPPPELVSWAGIRYLRGGPRDTASMIAQDGRGDDRGRGRGGDRGRGRGGDRGRGRGGGIVAAAPPAGSEVSIAPSVQAVGVKRPSYGTLGVPVDVIVNCFRADIPTAPIYHYDISILPEDKVLPQKATLDIIRKMQEQNPTVFTKQGSYDGRKNLYSPVKYSFGDKAQYEVNDGANRTPRRVRIQFAATIDPSSTARYIEGQMSRDEEISTTLNACNVAIRMKPIQDHPFSAWSFFTRDKVKDVYGGVELWAGFFQSVRPAIGQMVVNLDISSAAFYKSGTLIKLCMEYLGKSPEGDPVPFLSGNRLDQRTRRDLLKFIRNLNVRTQRNGQSRVRAIKDISDKGADTLTFSADGATISVAAWFRRETGRALRYPSLVCVQLSRTAWVPLECCDVVPGQFYHKTLTPDQTEKMIEFSTFKPDARLRNIRSGLQELSYSNSTYLQDFGINVDPNPMTVTGRILPTPTLIYGRNSSIVPRDGQWNMRDKLLYRPERITGCGILIYDGRFRADSEQNLKKMLYDACRSVGIQGMPQDPPVLRKNATGGAYWNHIKELGTLHKQVKGTMPNLIVVILPNSGNEDIYVRIKNAGDIKIGVATQCLKSQKCARGNMQYFANVCLKINAKLGGINVVPRRDSIGFVRDIADPTLVIGADVIHPEPGQGGRLSGRPSYAAVVGSVDSGISKYIAVSRAQGSRVEMIEDLADMVAHIIKKYMQYRKDVEKNADPAPRRVLFYRDGISERQLRECKEVEVPAIFRACDRVNIPRPKLTFVVVSKRHHVRFFPPPGGSSDRSGNVPAGLVIDREIGSPVEFDFYLQSHGGLLGTSRSAHYSVLVDQNDFMPDELQRLSFSLCHVYARATRSVSIVTPVYYANIVCARAKHHYDPDPDWDAQWSTRATAGLGVDPVETLRRAFQPIHPNIGQQMYFQ